MSVIDTPDNQVGVVSAQQLLATVPTGHLTATIGIPPNAETLVLATSASGPAQTAQVVGVTSGIYYPQLQISTPGGGLQWNTTFVDISDAVDSQVTLNFKSVLTSPCYVYSDAAVHFTPDPATANAAVTLTDPPPASALMIAVTDGTNAQAIRSNKRGELYVIPSLPDIATGDHPLVELLYKTSILAASGAVLAAPGAGTRYRIFAANLVPFTNAQNGYICDSITGTAFVGAANLVPGSMSYAPTGIALTNNAAVNYVLNGGAGDVFASVAYTLETI